MPAAEEALRDLQRLVRRPPSVTERATMTRRLPQDLATSETQFIGVLADEVEAAQKATAALRDDLRFDCPSVGGFSSSLKSASGNSAYHSP